MKTNILRKLNADAKSWPYYKGDRVKQRRSIMDSFEMLCQIWSAPQFPWGAPGAITVRGIHGETSLHYKGKYGDATLSGAGPKDFEFYVGLGIPGIDCMPAEFTKLARVSINGSMYALPWHRIDPTPGALSYRPLPEVARGYADAGCRLYNIELEG